MSGTCYLVGTPIGNLKDITLRALETLKSVDVIACEDTRHTLALLNAYEIKKPLISYYKQKEREGTEKILAMLSEGKSVALVTDAGMPGISDPGAVLVRALRENGCAVETVPGPTAVATAVSLAGLEQNGFAFAGFLPERKKERDKLVDALSRIPLPLVFYCAPHDLGDTLSYLYKKLGARKACAAKELTKLHETVYEGRLGTLEIENGKGEFVLIIEGNSVAEDTENKPDIAELLKTYTGEGMSRSEAVKRVAAETGLPKNTVYAASLALKDFAE